MRSAAMLVTGIALVLFALVQDGGAALPALLDAERVAGVPLLVLLALIAAATLVSEDLACVAAGLLVAGGAVGFLPGTLACLCGIVAGDLLLVLAGRALGPRALARPPLSWFVRAGDLDRGRAFFARRGGGAVFAARFVPGLRLPTYLAAGLLGMRLAPFLGWFLLGAAVWTPLLVGGSALLGRGAVELLATYSRVTPLLVAGLLLGAWARPHVLPAVARQTWHALRGLRRRWTRWEFWPLWLFYPPVIAHIVGLALCGRWKVTAFTAANPAIDAGGLIGESKSQILAGLAGSGRVASWFIVPRDGTPEQRLQAAWRGLAAHGLTLPVVVKPDAGQRGLDVSVCRGAGELERAVAALRDDLIIQAYVPGVEYGVFYARRPDVARGRIISITEKRMPILVGDGKRTLEQLVLNDDRAVALARVYLAANEQRRALVPAVGERVQLVELGTHCRGAIFLDGIDHCTTELERAIDDAARSFEGFHFGRFDVRAPSQDAFRRGEFTIIELNGITSEVTHIYDPRNSLFEAYRALFEQWRLAFEIGQINVDLGHPTVPPSGLLQRVFAFRRRRASS